MKRSKKFTAKNLSALIHYLNSVFGVPGQVYPTYYSFIWCEGMYAIGVRNGSCFGATEISHIPSNWSWIVKYDHIEDCYAICFCRQFDD